MTRSRSPRARPDRVHRPSPPGRSDELDALRAQVLERYDGLRARWLAARRAAREGERSAAGQGGSSHDENKFK